MDGLHPAQLQIQDGFGWGLFWLGVTHKTKITTWSDMDLDVTRQNLLPIFASVFKGD